MARIDHKRGDTLSWKVRVAMGDSLEPVNIDGWQFACHVRRLGALVDELAPVAITAASGRFGLTLPAVDSATWPAALCEADIQMTDAAGNRVSSDTFVVRVLEDQTQ